MRPESEEQRQKANNQGWTCVEGRPRFLDDYRAKE
jgi:hypothetical protein